MRNGEDGKYASENEQGCKYFWVDARKDRTDIFPTSCQKKLQHLQACFFYVYSAESKMGSLIPQFLLFVH